MLKSMIALGKMQFNQYNIYKSNFWLFTLNRIVEIVVYIFVWQAIYNQTGNAGGYTIAQMTTDYIFRSFMFIIRYKSGRWKQSKSFST